MRRSSAALAFVAAAGLAQEAAPPAVEAVAPGVFAVLQPAERRFEDSNSAAIVLGDGLLVVDAQATLGATQSTIAALQRHTSLPVRWLVLTHWHGDHLQGAATYRVAWPDLEIVGHASLAADVPGRAEPMLDEEIGRRAEAIAAARDRLARGVDRHGAPLDAERRATLTGQIGAAEAKLADLESLPRPLAAPTLLHGEGLRLRRGAREVQLLHFEAHTRGDTVLYLPAEKVLFTGDVVDDLPYGGHGYPSRWLEALRGLAALDIETIVPGHGSVRRGKEHLLRVLALYESIVTQAAASVAAGRDLAATQGALDLADHRSYFVGDDPVAATAWDDFIPATIEHAWLEARSELPD